MKKIKLTTAAVFAYCILHTACCFSQGTAINSTGAAADSSAIFDASSTNKGLLIPRVALTGTTDVTTIPNPANSLLVFDTLPAGDITETGYYYWDGGNSKWVKLATGTGLTGPTGPAGATGATGTTGATGASSSCFNLSFPDGFSGMTPVSMKNLSTSNYTVPAGKNLYITNIFISDLFFNLLINSKVISVSWWNASSGYGPIGLLATPIIAGNSDVISANNNSVAINGFLVDAVVSPVTKNNLKTTPYTVPAGKTFFITNLYAVSNYKIYINGIQFSYSDWNNVTSKSASMLHLPLIAGSGSIISTDNDANFVINGFLY